MNNLPKVFVGVDVSKNNLDVFVHPVKKQLKIENSEEGVAKLKKELSGYDVQRVVCESSGGYEYLLLSTLKNSGYKTWLVDPKRIKAFIVSEGIKAKTDAIDAKMIARFAAEKDSTYESQRCFDEESTKLSALYKRKTDLTEMLVMEKLRLDHPMTKACKNLIEQHIDFLEQQRQAVDSEIDTMIKNNNDWSNKAKIVESVPGIGKATAAALIAELPELGKIENKQIAALLGVAPFTRQSGEWKGNASISGGRSAPRNAVYMATLSAMRYNPVIKIFYERLRKAGKPAKVAIVAAMRKMITIINTILRKAQMWVACL